MRRGRRVRAAAEQIGANSIIGDLIGRLPDGFLFDLLEGFLGQLFQCEAPVDGADVQAMVKEHYKGGRYDRPFFARVAREARRQARRDGSRITRSESHQVAQATLDYLRKEDEETLSAAITELAIG